MALEFRSKRIRYVHAEKATQPLLYRVSGSIYNYEPLYDILCVFHNCAARLMRACTCTRYMHEVAPPPQLQNSGVPNIKLGGGDTVLLRCAWASLNSKTMTYRIFNLNKIVG